jgi:hypothetical protein
MPKIVAESDGFGQLFVQLQDLGDAPGDLRHLEGVRQPGPIVVTRRGKKDLRLVLETTEGLAVDHPVPVALKRGADGISGLVAQPATRVAALRRLGRQDLALAILELLTDVGHGSILRGSGLGQRAAGSGSIR